MAQSYHDEDSTLPRTSHLMQMNVCVCILIIIPCMNAWCSNNQAWYSKVEILVRTAERVRICHLTDLVSSDDSSKHTSHLTLQQAHEETGKCHGEDGLRAEVGQDGSEGCH